MDLTPALAELLTRVPQAARPDGGQAAALIKAHLASSDDDRWMSIATIALRQVADGDLLSLPGVTLLEALRLDRGLTRQQVADGAGISTKTIRSYELLEIAPSAKPLNALATFYGVRTSVLLADLRNRTNTKDA